MKESLQKYLFYITFSALGSFCAEVLSTNYPMALLNPFNYLVYGLIYIFFIDGLMRWKEKNFYIMYLFGFLVGLITETYMAKVTFYGLKPDESRIYGVSPGAILFVILFYHAFFSFLMPLYLAKRIFSFPLQITGKKRIDFLVMLIPFILLPAVYSQLIMGHRNVLFLISKKERKYLLIFTIVSSFISNFFELIRL